MLSSPSNPYSEASLLEIPGRIVREVSLVKFTCSRTIKLHNKDDKVDFADRDDRAVREYDHDLLRDYVRVSAHHESGYVQRMLR